MTQELPLPETTREPENLARPRDTLHCHHKNAQKPRSERPMFGNQILANVCDTHLLSLVLLADKPNH